MTLLRSFPALVFLMVLLSIGTLCVAQRSLQLLLVAGTLSAISWYVTEGPRGRILPKWVSNLLVIGVSLNVFVDFLQHRGDPLGVLGRFAVWLTLVKLYERRTARDHAQLMLLSLLLMITGCLHAPADFLMGIGVLVYSALGLYVLLLYQLHSAFERSRIERQSQIPHGYRLVPPLKPTVGRRASLHFRSQAASIGVLGAMLSIVAFVAIPRDFGADLLSGLGARSASRKTQFTNQVDLLTNGRVNDNHIQVMTVRLTDANGHAVKLDEPLRLRGGVCDQYAGRGQWRPARERFRPQRLEPAARETVSLLPRSIEAGTWLTQRVSFMRGGNHLFTLYAPVDVTPDEAMVLHYDTSSQTLISDRGCITSGFTARIATNPDERVSESLMDGAIPALSGAPYSDRNGRVHDLAEQILLRAGIKLSENGRVSRGDWSAYRAASDAFTRHLQSGEYAYTLDLSDVVQPRGDYDPVAQFLIQTRRGHCEFFASGLVALCHVVGVPARIVTGYAAWEFDDAVQQYQVFESNAHAWAEALTGPHQWTTFDPTPAAVLMQPRAEEGTLADTVRSLYERLEGNWSMHIASFDSSAQNRLADSLNFGWSDKFAQALSAVRDWMERVNIFFNVGPGGYIWMGIVAVALVLAVMALVKLMRRSRAIRRATGLAHVRGAEYRRMLTHLGFYIDMLRVLRRGGVPKPEWQPPREFAMTLSRSRPIAGGVALRIAEVFYQVRFGGQRLGREEHQEVQKLLGDLAAALKVRR